MTSGSQQALDFWVASFLTQGRYIEGLGHLGVPGVFRGMEPNVHTIDMDEEGIRTDLRGKAFKELADQGRNLSSSMLYSATLTTWKRRTKTN